MPCEHEVTQCWDYRPGIGEFLYPSGPTLENGEPGVPEQQYSREAAQNVPERKYKQTRTAQNPLSTRVEKATCGLVHIDNGSRNYKAGLSGPRMR